MKRSIRILLSSILLFAVLLCTGTVTLAKGNPSNNNSKTNTASAANITKANESLENKTYEGKIISEVNTTWGEFLDEYIKEHKDITYCNPRPDISKDHKVRVVKTEYANGCIAKPGYFGYGLITQIYDEKTGELLSSNGEYSNPINTNRP